jgi:hypothetical protein
MSSMKRMVLAVIAMALASSAFGASAALAAPEWYATTPQWAQGGTALTGSVGTTWSGTVTLTDEGWPATTVQCNDSGAGTAGAAAAGTETSWTLTGCTLVHAGNCERFEEVKATGLPWSTELGYSGGSVKESYLTTGASFVIKCVYTGGLKIADQCNIRPDTYTLTNASEGVNAAFGSEKTNCSLGGNGKGSFTGTRLIKATAGPKLEVLGVSKKLTSSLAVTATGKLRLEDTGFGGFGAECEVETTGTLGTAGKGTITGYNAHGCVGVNGCPTLSTTEPLNLPWNTEVNALYENQILSGGSGTPGWRFRCSGGGSFEDRCNLNEFPQLTNSAGNVVMAFSEAERTGCTIGGSGKGKWTGTLTIAHPSSVEAIKIQ